MNQGQVVVVVVVVILYDFVCICVCRKGNCVILAWRIGRSSVNWIITLIISALRLGSAGFLLIRQDADAFSLMTRLKLFSTLLCVYSIDLFILLLAVYVVVAINNSNK